METYDTSIIHHTIPMMPDVKLVQQKLRKIHPNLETQIKTKMNKFLKAKIIFPVRNSKWVLNIIPVRKKNGDIQICIDFRILNKVSLKENYPLLKMDHILQRVVGSSRMSLLDGYSGYNQILVHEDDQLKTTFMTPRGTLCTPRCHLG